MAASNPTRILETLNKHLQQPIEMTLFGRAALHLGFSPPLGGTASALTKDVDIIIAVEEEKTLEENDQFWEALDKTNAELEPEGLYLTHIFVENQTILRRNWKAERQRIEMPSLSRLTLWRPDALDLILTKMTRSSDPEDRKDILELIDAEGLTEADLKRVFEEAVCPPFDDVKEQFSIGKQLINGYFRQKEMQKSAYGMSGLKAGKNIERGKKRGGAEPPSL
jgi:hypothetical protein